MKTMTDQKGVAVVEFAIVLPLLLVIVFGIVEFGLLMYNKAIITNASREGARAGIVQGSPRPIQSEIRAVVTNYLNTVRPITFGGPGLATPTVATANPSGGVQCSAFGQDLIVGVKYTYRFLVLPNVIALMNGTFTQSIDLVATTDMKCE